MRQPQEIVMNAIEGLRPRFLAAMAEHLDHMEDAYDVLLLDNLAQDAMRELAFRAHRVAGIAGTFGWADIGTLARQTEEALNKQLATPDTDKGYITAVDTLIEALAHALDP